MEEPEKKSSIAWGKGLLNLIEWTVQAILEAILWVFGRILAFLRAIGNLLPF